MSGNFPKIGVGVIGAGAAGFAHIDALRRLGFVEVVAVATSTEETANYNAEKLSIPKAHGDYEKLIEDADVQVVHVATPNYLHYRQIRKCLEFDKHIICEKPLGIDSKQTSDLANLARNKNVVNAVNFNMRYFPAVQQAKVLRKNLLGSILMIHGSVLEDSLLSETNYDWRVEPKKGGPTQVIATVGCHWLDLVQFVSGLKIKSVLADFGNVFPRRKKMLRNSGKWEEIEAPLEDYATILLRFNNGAKGAVVFSQISAGRKFEVFFEMSGSKGAISWSNSPTPEALWFGYQKEPNRLFLKDKNLFDKEAFKYIECAPGQVEGYQDTFKQHFKIIYEYILCQKNIKGVKPDFPTFETGHNIQVIIDSIVTSAKEEKWIDVERT